MGCVSKLSGLFDFRGFFIFLKYRFVQTIENLREELPRAFSSEPAGILVNGEKYIFIRNEDNFAVFRKSADGMIIVKLNQGKTSNN